MRTREAGQAAIESALTLPLVIFLVLGTIQLFLMLQARIVARYAVFKAVRAGVVNHGACGPMMDAALATLLPTFARTDSTTALVEAFALRKDGGRYRYNPAVDQARTEPILEITRAPLTVAGDEDPSFDQPSFGKAPQRLTAQLVFWFPLRIPFADWVMSRMFLAHFQLQAFAGHNVLMPPLPPKDGWMEGATLDGSLAQELQRRVGMAQYDFPIVVSSSMRMMTPVRALDAAGTCAGAAK